MSLIRRDLSHFLGVLEGETNGELREYVRKVVFVPLPGFVFPHLVFFSGKLLFNLSGDHLLISLLSLFSLLLRYICGCPRGSDQKTVTAQPLAHKVRKDRFRYPGCHSSYDFLRGVRRRVCGSLLDHGLARILERRRYGFSKKSGIYAVDFGAANSR